ncbi:SDR family NAD(P)-dependent oxidoreductase [Microlunatus elymi]|uniref:SDR family NAD(P)-dependent oxidoreductase n=1 Tax=Microlunatus elymi TaxID=2596828 RepID=A0A516Q047_9ACTN|nr:NmrA family NAD(P)-binding protein [Microlunatus elymi]QDP96762.1 SDR family NAD(P)-dependent oxidoreductase [Microlunatus elymi]
MPRPIGLHAVQHQVDVPHPVLGDPARQCRGADRARDAGVAQIVSVSVRDAKPGNKLSSGVHGEVDEHLRGSDVPYAIVQPTMFMQNLLRDLRDDRFHGAYGTAPANYIDARDIGDVAAALLTGRVGPSRDYLLTGPQSLTHQEIATAMTVALGREIRYVDLPPSELAQRFRDEGVPEPYATDLPAAQTASPLSWAEVNRTVEEVTGRPARMLNEFLRDHADVLQR